MALLNTSGNPVATQPHVMQIDIPAEPVANLGAIDIAKVLGALWQLLAAIPTGNPALIIAAMQALMAALFSK